MNDNLIREFEVEEISTVIQEMAHLKSTQPDGFPTSFYQDNWDVLKKEVYAAFNSFF